MSDDLFARAMPKTPRPHQIEAVARLRAALAEGHKRVCLSLATGAGKTFIASMIVSGALAKGNRVCFTVPTLSLVDQTVRAFLAEGIDRIGVIQGNHPRRDAMAPVQVASVQTLARRDRPAASVVIVDECHQRSEAVRRWMKEAPETVFIGLSATPGRDGMAGEYESLVVGATTRELIDAKVLSSFRTFAAASPDLAGVRTVAGDYHEGQLSQVMSGVRMVADVVTTWLDKGEGRPTLCFAVDRAHARNLQADFEAVGVPCGYVDAHTDDVSRRLIAERFRKGELPVVVNVRCLTTGVDWDVRCIIMARPTKSTMLWVQMVGRGLRTARGKDDCVILDHSDNSLRLGFVSDIAFDLSIGTGSGPWIGVQEGPRCGCGEL
ncbi:DEAD/DEAH box helicase, partial [Rubellimicrobium roseum]